MKKLLVIRHAKSSWDHPGLSDKDRPLNTRGLRDAPYMAQIIANILQGSLHIISSPAARALNTALIFNQNINPLGTEINVNELLYYGNEEDYLETIRNVNDSVQTLAIFGHNPNIEYFVMKSNAGRLDAIPTCAVILYELKLEHWANINWESLKMINKYFPKEQSF